MHYIYCMLWLTNIRYRYCSNPSIDNHHLDQTFKYKSRHVEDVATRLHTDYLNELQQLSLLQDITLHHETQENFKSYSFLWKANYYLKHCIRSTSQQTMAAKTFSEYSMNDSFNSLNNVTSPVCTYVWYCIILQCIYHMVGYGIS